MITNLIGVGAEGIYAVGSKLGHASQLIYTAFAGGWQFFAFSTMKEKDQVQSNSNIFEYLGIISYIATAFVCVFSFWIFRLLFDEEYLEGYIIAPYLFLAPLLLMLFQVASNQFIVIKKTWPNMFILLSGALLNVILNLVLIPTIGIEGASIATLVGYIVSDIVAIIVLCKMKLMIISKRFLLISVCMAIYFIIWRFFITRSTIIEIGLAAIFTITCILFYKKELLMLIKKIKTKF